MFSSTTNNRTQSGDDSFGDRIAYDSDEMPSVNDQQYAMQRVVDGLSRIHLRCMHFMGTEMGYHPICSWPGLRFNHREEVISIYWDFFEIDGSIDLQHLPRTVEVVILYRAWYVKVPSLSSLPPILRVLLIPSGLVNGELRMADLPRTLEELDVSNTGLSGELDFSKCPPQLRIFNGSQNKFTGSFSSRQLPSHIREIDLEHNKLYFYCPKLDKLPRSLEILKLSHNMFRGNAIMKDLHEGMKEIWLEGNDFVRYSVYGEVPTTLKEIRVGYNETIKGRTYCNGCIFEANHTSKNLLDYIPQCEKTRKTFY